MQDKPRKLRNGKLAPIKKNVRDLSSDPKHSSNTEADSEQLLPRATLSGPQRWPDIDGYVIEQHLGSGGFGDVFKAYSTELRAHVAIKILKPSFSLDEVFAKRFQQEVQAAAISRHANVVQVLGRGVATNSPHEGCRYLVTEYLPGGSLAEWIERHSFSKPADLRSAINILVGVCRGLEAIHRKGIVHRDLKPDNILLDEEGAPRIGDFGFSSLDSSGDERLTRSDQFFGTLPYMAPEQILGARNAVPASDQYPVGVMLHLLLYDRRPWQDCRNDEKERSRILSSLSVLPSFPKQEHGVADARLKQICFRCLMPNPSDRYPSVSDVRADLESWLSETDPGRQRTTASVLMKCTIGALFVAIALLVSIGARAILFPSSTSNDRDLASQPKDGSPSTTVTMGSAEPEETVPNEGGPSEEAFDRFARDRQAVTWVHSVGGEPRAPGWELLLDDSAKSDVRLFYARLWGRPVDNLSRIAGLPELWWLELNETAIDSDDLQNILSIPSLQRLALANTKLDSSDFGQLESLSYLSYLEISISQVTDNWEFLARLPYLRSLCLWGDEPDGIEQLAKHANLREVHFVDLTPAEIDEQILQDIQNEHPMLSIIGKDELYVGKQPKRDAAARLTELDWEVEQPTTGTKLTAPKGCKLTQHQIEQLNALGHWLVRCDLSGCSGLDGLVKTLKGRMVGTLILNGASVDDDWLTRLAKNDVLIENEIDLRNTQVTIDGIKVFKRRQPNSKILSNFGTFESEHSLPAR